MINGTSATAPKAAAARWGSAPGWGVFLSCVVLESAGAAMVSAVGKSAALDPGVYTSVMPSVLGKLTLFCIALGRSPRTR